MTFVIVFQNNTAPCLPDYYVLTGKPLKPFSTAPHPIPKRGESTVCSKRMPTPRLQQKPHYLRHRLIDASRDRRTYILQSISVASATLTFIRPAMSGAIR